MSKPGRGHGIVAALTAVVLTGCATDNGVSRQRIDPNEPLPLVLRVAAEKVGDPAIASPEGSAAGTAVKPVLEALGYSTMTLGLSLLMAPVAVAAGVEEGVRVYERMNDCRNRWNNLFGDPLAWFRQTFGDVSLADQLAADVPALVANARSPLQVEMMRDPAAERSTARNMVAANVEFGLAQTSSADCGAVIRARAIVELRHAGVEQPLGQRRLVVERQISGNRLERWVTSPEMAREDLRSVVADIADKIALTYPQFAAVSVVAAQEPIGTSAVCSTDEMVPAGTVRCWYESIEQCKRVATHSMDGRTPAECIPRSALLPRWCFARSPGAVAGPLTYVADCGGQPLPIEPTRAEGTPAPGPVASPAAPQNAASGTGSSRGSTVSAVLGDAMRKTIGLPPDPAQAIGLVDLEGETPELALGTMRIPNERGLLVVTDRFVRYYDVDTKRAKQVMRFDEIASVRIDASGGPFMSSCKCAVVIDWRPGERRTKLELLFVKGPLIGDPAAAEKAVQAIRARLSAATP